MKKIPAILLLTLVLYSCKDDTKEKLVGKWQQIYSSEPLIDENLQHMQHYVDTFGKHTTPAENEVLYHTQNIDSLRAFYQSQVDSFMVLTQQAITNTRYHFRDDNIVFKTNGDQSDSATWYVEDKKFLVLDEPRLKGNGSVVKYEIVKLTKDSLELKFTEPDNTVTEVFRLAE